MIVPEDCNDCLAVDLCSDEVERDSGACMNFHMRTKYMNNWDSFDILVAHESDPYDFQHEMIIQVKAEIEPEEFVNEICDALTERQVRDCIWKIKND